MCASFYTPDELTNSVDSDAWPDRCYTLQNPLRLRDRPKWRNAADLATTYHPFKRVVVFEDKRVSSVSVELKEKDYELSDRSTAAR